MAKDQWWYSKRGRSKVSGHICKSEKDLQASWCVILLVSEGSNLRSRNYSPFIRGGEEKSAQLTSKSAYGF
ncbi:hypothetical protein GZ78_09850 [Endozoicomonas numazuensis]|uniref:Uncharacterized protein n=1 Tax=Endozoicomonas numazuensis TaxID=1137799 RepID=A0A081NHJ9_9GAMM|nr:hypothetical protein GZ78_09850 [Endozoicomonas numazuensis]